MNRLPWSIWAAFAALSTLRLDVADAAECSDAEWQSSQSIWRWAATTSACAKYAVGDNFVSAPCTATSCVAVMEQVGEQLPDCTVSGVNNKVEVQNAMTVCNGEEFISTDAPFVSPPTAAPLVTIAPITTSAPFKTSAPLSSLAPRPGGSASGSAETTTTTTTPSTAFDSSLDSSLSFGSSTDTLSPAATSSTTSCTVSQVASIVRLYTDATKSSSCAPDASISSYSVYIFTKCASSCATKLKTLAGDLPNCYYDYESLNKKTSLLQQIDDCTGTNHANYISTTVYPSTTAVTSGAVASHSRHIDFAVGIVLLASVKLLL